MGEAGGGCVGRACGCPTIGAGIVSAPGAKKVRASPSTPDDHFAPSPDCSVTRSERGRVGEAGSCPTVRYGIVFPTTATSTPDDHFTAGPDCSVSTSRLRRVEGVGSRPTVRAGIVSPAGVHEVAAPDDHFTASPWARVWQAERELATLSLSALKFAE